MSALDGVARRIRDADRTRLAALAAVAALLGTALQVMYHFIDVVGLPLNFLLVVAASFAVATAVARYIRPAVAVGVAAALLVAGLGWYVTRLGGSPEWGAMTADALSILSGRSLLRISNIRAWVLGVTPAPVFLTWYFAVRRRYAPAVLAAGTALAVFVLSGDADVITTLSGAVAGAAAIGLGDFDRRGEPVLRAETIAVVVAAMIVVPTIVSVVPATTGADVPLSGEVGGADTVEASLLSADEDLSVQGDISLSPEARYTVTSRTGTYWRVGSYDRYTGDGWVRTGSVNSYDGRIQGPPGPSRTVRQTVRAESETTAMPAAWKPVEVSGYDGTRVASDGSLQPSGSIPTNESYTVVSDVPAATTQQLQDAGTDYPGAIQRRYTGLPDSTPDRVAERTETITANAETPYETALVVEQWLENNKGYSLDVNRPNGDVADGFLFEMDAGYCTYFATTMVSMLRTQDIPARFVVGYTPGERVAEDRWVVRGLNAHAWVEAYFPEHGWIRFDPTPSDPRADARSDAIDDARERNVSGVDTNETGIEEWTPTPASTPEPQGTADPGAGPNETVTPPPGEAGLGITDDGITATLESPEAGPAQTTEGADDDEGFLPRTPTRQEAALALVALLGSVVGIRRSGVGRRLYRAAWLRYQPRTDPETDVERAFQRLIYHLDRTHYRTRQPDETVRAYLDAIDADDRARRVAELRERARYRGTVTEAEADEAVGLVNDLVR